MRYDEVTSGNFTFKKTSMKGLVLIEAKIHGDQRGFFMESYHKNAFRQGGILADFVQDNQSRSSRGVLRGLHFQIKKPQGKLVRVLAGEVFDVAVDLRRNSQTYGKWEGFTLSAENRQMLYVPAGFAHGFLVMSETADYAYKCTDFYDPGDESGIQYNDPTIGIEWPTDGMETLLVSEKDRKLGSYQSYKQGDEVMC